MDDFESNPLIYSEEYSGINENSALLLNDSNGLSSAGIDNDSTISQKGTSN